MQNNFIIELLGIKDKNVDVWDMHQSDNVLTVELYTKVKQQKCPTCNTKTKLSHAYRTQAIQGPILSGISVQVLLKKRRYFCKGCNRTFFERLQMVEHYQRCLNSLQMTALTYAAVNSFKTAARMVGITTNRLIRLFDCRKIETKKVLPRVIGIDEFKGDAGGERFQTIVADLENKEIIEILPDRKIDTIMAYLRSCDTGNVQIVVMDLSKAFKSAVRKALGNPLIIADRFHYMRQVYWAFDAVRREVQHDLEKKDRIHMKRSKELLWKSIYKLSDEERERVAELLKVDSRLQEAYELKTKLDQWFKESNEYTAKKGFEYCLKLMKDSNIPAFEKVVKTFKNWKTEILNSFLYPFNNGYIEGVNNKIKVLKRNSYGIKSFERLRKKILWQELVE